MELTTKTIFEQFITQTLQKNPERAKNLHGAYQFNITGTDGGYYYVVFNGDHSRVNIGTTDNPLITITASDADFLGMVRGHLNTQLAFMIGKVKIAGRLGHAVKLQSLLG